jgi:hypothetical protein
MLRINKTANGDVVFTLSGRIDKEDIAELEALIGAEGHDSDGLRTASIFSLIAKRLALLWLIAIHTSASGSRDKDSERSGRWLLGEKAALAAIHTI